MQVADCQDAPLQQAAQQFCRQLRRAHPLAPKQWKRLKRGTATLRSAIVGRTTHTATGCNLTKLLVRTPQCIGLHAVHSRLQPAPANESTAAAPILDLDVHCDAVVDNIPALLQARAEVQALSMHMYEPGSGTPHGAGVALCDKAL